MTHRPNHTERLQTVLTRLAGDQRRAAAYYGNLEARPGTSQLRRVLSDVGFPTGSQFSYLAPASAHVTRNEDARTPTRVTICPYGVVEDRARIISTSEVDRRVRTDHRSGTTGLRICPWDSAYLVSAELDDNTYAETKTVRVVQAVTNPRQGPAYHAMITRRGDVFIVAAVDDTTRAAGDNAEVSIDVALESALAIGAADHAARRFDKLWELPMTPLQATALAVLAGKIRAAYPNLAQQLVAPDAEGSGYAYRWPIETEDAPSLNFSNGTWIGVSPFSHENSDVPGFFSIVSSIPAFDLTTEVFRTASDPPARAGRVEAQVAIAETDTAGAESVLLGAYTAIAANERAAEMQRASRLQVFVQRINVAHHDANATGQAAGQVSDATAPAAPPAATNVGPHVFDFVTGLWGDGRPY